MEIDGGRWRSIKMHELSTRIRGKSMNINQSPSTSHQSSRKSIEGRWTSSSTHQILNKFMNVMQINHRHSEFIRSSSQLKQMGVQQMHRHFINTNENLLEVDSKQPKSANRYTQIMESDGDLSKLIRCSSQFTGHHWQSIKIRQYLSKLHEHPLKVDDHKVEFFKFQIKWMEPDGKPMRISKHYQMCNKSQGHAMNIHQQSSAFPHKSWESIGSRWRSIKIREVRITMHEERW